MVRFVNSLGGKSAVTASSDRWAQQYGLYLPRTLLAWQSAVEPEPVLETEGTFLLVDISGFTALSEMLAEKGKVGSEEVTDILNAAFTELLDIVMLDGGDLLRFGGDALFNLFTGEGHAARACRSALDMRDALEEFQQTRSPAPLKMSVGVASGPITAVLAGESSYEPLFIGPTASEVVALQTAAEPGEILVAQSTVDLLDDDVVGDSKAGGFLLVDEPDIDDFDDEEDEVDVGEVDLSQFVPTRLRQHLSISFNEGEHRPATIAFLKFTGTDAAFAEEGPAAVGEKLSTLVAMTQRIADKYGVAFLAADVDDDGGKLILSSGVPERSSGRGGERIVNALVEIAASNPPFPVHAGVARGHVFAGDLGARFRRVYTVMGDTVNLAARLAAKAAAGEVYVTARALDKSADKFETVELEPIALKGKTKPVAPLRIGARIGTEDEARSGAGLELIGRDDEVAVVVAALDDALAGRGNVLEVVGNPGMGKSLIVASAMEGAERQIRELHVNCERYEAATPYHAASQLMRSALGLKEKEAEQLGEDLIAIVAEVAPEQLHWSPLLADIVRASVPATPEADALAEEFRQQTRHDAALAVLAAALDNESAAIVIEDSHWADDSSRQLFQAAAATTSDHSWCVITVRSADEGEPITASVETLEIGPLGEDAAVELVTAVAGESTPLPFAQEIARRAGGNPFYIVELAKSSTTFDAADLPETVEAVTLARIDRLRQSDRRLLRYASVFGESLAVDLLADALPDIAPSVDDPELWGRLGEFLDTSSIGKIRFRQMIVRDVAYTGLPFKRRTEIHLAIAEALERRARRRPERFAEAMSLHFDRAQEWERSWTYSTMAGDRAVRKMAHVEAMRIYRRGLRAAENLDVDRTDVLRIEEAIGDAAEHMGMLAEAEEAYDRCLAADVDPATAGRLLRKKGLLYVESGDLDRARDLLNEALTILEAPEPTEESVESQLEVMVIMAGLYFRLADFSATVDWCTKAIDLAGDSYPAALAHAFYIRSLAHTHLGGETGITDGERSLELYEEVGDLVGQTKILNVLGIHSYYRGQWDDAVDYYTRSAERGAKSGDIVRTASSMHNIGEIRLDQGRYEEVEEPLRKGLRIFQGASFVAGTGTTHANLARLYTRVGRLDEAAAELDIARDQFTEAGMEADILEERIRRAELLIYTQKPDEAHTMVEELLASSEGVEGTEISRASLHRMAAYALAALGQHDDACEHIDASLELARDSASDYEIAQTLEAALRIEGADPDREAAEENLEAKLGIVARPWVPIYHR
ncbi:MAG: tetratricopeptide repeat protein [Acidimicrobiia bacterium]|nr:tetratricopeptide repeat protein [Acidimicrobiia bacterium]